MSQKGPATGASGPPPSSRHDPRPTSEQRVDLHIYMIPPELWREHLQSAVNQVINDTVSAGFIRVFPEATVASLRDEIETQIGFEIIPREFVFLKCVGRCFTRIKSRQEGLLKVKNFIPPQAYAPEMFILEATPDIRAMLDSGSVSVQSQASFQIGSRSDSGSFSGHNRVPPIKSNAVAIQTGKGSSGNSSDSEEFNERHHISTELPNHHGHNSKLKQGHVTSQKSPAVGRHDPKNGKNRPHRSSSAEDDGYDPPLSATPNHSPKMPLKSQNVKSVQTLNEKELRELEEQLRIQNEAEKAEKERLKKKKEEEERKKKEEEKRKKEEEEKKKKEEEERKRKEEERKKEEEAKRKKEEEERKRKEEEKRKKEEEQQKEEERKKEEEKRRKEEEKRKEEERKRKEEEHKREAEAKRKREEEEKRQEQLRKLEEEAQKKKALKQQQAAEKASLLDEIAELKAGREQMEQKKELLTKRTKQLQAKTPANKLSVRDNWKKKYFEEKKKTAPLDEHCNRLKRSLESVHKKVMTNLESVPPASARNESHTKEAINNNLQARSKQLEHDIEELQQRLEGIKMKLTGEMKLRNQAEKDMRMLRAELSQRKLQRHLPEGYRQSVRTQFVTAVPKS